MNKLLSSLVAATIAGAFSLSAMAADAAPAAPAGATAAEKPAAAPKAKKHVKKHVKKHAAKKLKRRSLTLPLRPSPRSNSSRTQKTALSGAVFYAVLARNDCHQRLRWPVTTPCISSSRGGVRLISQPGRIDDLVALDPHELPRWLGS